MLTREYQEESIYNMDTLGLFWRSLLSRGLSIRLQLRGQDGQELGLLNFLHQRYGDRQDAAVDYWNRKEPLILPPGVSENNGSGLDMKLEGLDDCPGLERLVGAFSTCRP